MPEFRTLAGHLTHGVVMGAVFGCFTVTGEVFSDMSWSFNEPIWGTPQVYYFNEVTICLWIGIFASCFFGALPLYVFWCIELDWKVQAMLVVKFLYALLIGFGSTAWVTQYAQYTVNFSLITGSIVFTVLLYASVVCFKKRMFDAMGIREESKIAPIIFTYVGIPNFMAIISSMFVCVIPSVFLRPAPYDQNSQETEKEGVTVTPEYRDVQAEKDLLGYLVFVLIFIAFWFSMLVTYLIAEQLEKRPVIYAVATTYGLLLV
jgi:hypothetical protein